MPRTANVLWRPNPGPQTKFLGRPEYEVLYGGAKGGGKTDAIIMEGTRQVDNGNYRALILRRTFPRLEEVIDRSKRYFPYIFPGAKYDGSSHRWHFPSGAVMRFGHMQTEADKYNYQGHEYQYIAFDQLEEFTWTQYSFMFGANRSSDPRLRCYIRATANPGGPGHAWVKQRFISIAPFGTPYVDPETGLSRVFIPAKVKDNPKLDQAKYVASLKGMDPMMREALLEGNWDVFAGMFFDGWDRDVHAVRYYPPPKEWPRFRAMDWGYAKPYSIGWYALMPGGALYRYRELYGWGGSANTGSRENADEVARKVAQIEREAGETGVFGPADPACWTSQGHLGPTIAESFASHGVHFTAADNDRVNGWNQCRQRLDVDRNGQALFYVADTCTHFVRTVPALVHDAAKAEDVDTDGEDHAGDEWRYMCMYRALAIEKPQAPDEPTLAALRTPDGHMLDIPRDDETPKDWWDH